MAYPVRLLLTSALAKRGKKTLPLTDISQQQLVFIWAAFIYVPGKMWMWGFYCLVGWGINIMTNAARPALNSPRSALRFSFYDWPNKKGMKKKWRQEAAHRTGAVSFGYIVENLHLAAATECCAVVSVGKSFLATAKRRMWFTVWRISPSFPWAYLMWCGGGGRKPRLISVLLYKNRARPKAEKRECACASVWKFLLALPSLGELRLKRSPKNEICRVRVWERRAKWLIFMHIYEIVGFYLSGIVSLLYYWNSHLEKHCGNILTLLMGTCAAITAAHLCENFFTMHHIHILISSV
jgi:hypothetical protein